MMLTSLFQGTSRELQSFTSDSFKESGNLLLLMALLIQLVISNKQVSLFLLPLLVSL